MKAEKDGSLPAGELELVLGYKPSKEQVLDIINRTRATGRPVGAVARDCSLPPVYYDFENTGYIDTPEGRMKIKDYQAKHRWLKLIIITSQDDTGSNLKTIDMEKILTDSDKNKISDFQLNVQNRVKSLNDLINAFNGWGNHLKLSKVKENFWNWYKIPFYFLTRC